MGSKWKKYTIEELAAPEKNALSTGPFGSAISSKFFVSAGVPVIRGGNLSADTSSRMSDEGLVFVSNEKAIEFHRSIVKRDDLIFTCWGTINQIGLIDDSCKYGKYIISNKQMKITLDKGKAYPLFVYYLFSSPEKQREILRNGIGAAVPGFNLGQLKSHVVTLPSVTEQVKIADFINEFDKKITLNRQINQTLEQMAQALFKSWFVDFDPVVDNALDAGFFEQNSDLPEALLRRAEQRKAVREQPDFKPLPAETRQLFPAAFEECEEPSLGLGGWVPKGWACSPLNAFINLIGGGTPKTSEESFWGGDIPWFSVVDAPNDSDVFVLKTEKYITEAGLSNSSAKLLRVGTTIISARGTVGKCALVGTPMAMNQSCYGINGIDGVADNFVYFMVRHLVSQLRQRSHGSVFSTITRDTFNSLKFIFPNVSLNDGFKDQTANWFERIHINNRQLSILQDLRDTLLPKLISGELRLNDDGILASGNTDR
ncbi:restriction endonuclease subunit S [Plesiomonas shigelloides]|uniref:restriction endonuclease subunit S n=1 Tax=Plesiomonas shigelloides TaxID=703 RepID=UPI002246E6A2|nr:restriction endonuclease subunit S [Plesiomonas shigelloides]MCX2497484.1 restriction endonuclease subunit S [Plesiomonas shigelloides]